MTCRTESSFGGRARVWPWNLVQLLDIGKHINHDRRIDLRIERAGTVFSLQQSSDYNPVSVMSVSGRFHSWHAVGMPWILSWLASYHLPHCKLATWQTKAFSSHKWSRIIVALLLVEQTIILTREGSAWLCSCTQFSSYRLLFFVIFF